MPAIDVSTQKESHIEVEPHRFPQEAEPLEERFFHVFALQIVDDGMEPEEHRVGHDLPQPQRERDEPRREETEAGAPHKVL